MRMLSPLPPLQRCALPPPCLHFRLHLRHNSTPLAAPLHAQAHAQGGSTGTKGEEESHGWKRILDRQWLLPSAASKVKEVSGREEEGGSEAQAQGGVFHVIRDDLLHPIMGGNKLRKLDALIPLVQAHGATDVVTCGGCQSAHTAAVAVACAEVGMKAHLLLRGERPAIPTGYNLVTGMYGHMTYIPRSEYADRRAMLQKHAVHIAGDPSRVISLQDRELSLESSMPGGSVPGGVAPDDTKKRVVILNEGAGDCFAVLGLIRLVDYLSQPSVFGKKDRVRIVVDCGTGTTAVGLALGISLYGLSWQVVGVMLADNQQGYEKHADRLLTEFTQQFNAQTWRADSCPQVSSGLPILWQERRRPRRFGRILPGEVETCRQIARRTGVLLDPIYTLAGWEAAHDLCKNKVEGGGLVALLHTGGTLGLFGLAQRYPLQF